MPIITDPGNRQGLTSGSLVDWIETLAMVPLLAVAVCVVPVLAAWSLRGQRHRAGSVAPARK